MTSAYQPTTEPEYCESLESIDEKTTCNPMQRWGSGKRQREMDQERDPTGRYTSNSSEEKAKDESSGRPLFRSCLSSHDPKSGLTPAGSVQSLPSPSTEQQPKTGSTTKLSRVQTLRKKIVHGTEQFLGLGDCEEDHINLQKKWTHRRQRHFSKRYGKLINDDAVDGQPISGPAQLRSPSVKGSVGSFYESSDPTLFRTLSRRESVARMAWNGLRSRLKSGSLIRDAQVQKPVSSLLEVGRSFAPHSVGEKAEGFEEEEEDDDVFFDFVPRNRRSMQALHDIALPKIEEEKPEIPADDAFGKDEVEGPPMPQKVDRQISTTSTRGHRIANNMRPPKPKNANRRQYGKGLVGRMLNRTIRRKRLTSEVRKQLEHLTDHRPYFTYWVSFVQVIVLIVTLSLYGVAPIGFTKTKRAEVIQRSRGGGLVSERIEDAEPDNFWIGPDQKSLITLGAKFAPCMRVDNILMNEIKKEKAIEAETGCCIKTDGSGCIQTSKKLCSKSFATFNYNTTTGDPNRKDRVVCGQDPNICIKPPSVKPNEWSKVITKWPICVANPTNVNPDKYPHMVCEITGRPCCIKQQGLCRIVSRDECRFWKGEYHEEATLCSQVDCLGATCGMLSFVKPDKPDQIYRLWMALFLHAGIIHLACTLVFNFFILRDIERMAGWLRVCIIYLFSGIGGYLVSAIVIPYQVEVGPSGSMFGIIACLFVELIQSWQMIAQPWKALSKLCGIVLLLLLVGLLPYVDNFAHMSGFMFGFLLALIFLPYVTFGKWDRRRKRLQILVSLATFITIFAVLFVVFLVDQETNCEACKYLNCVPFTEGFCENYNLGQKLQSRIL